MKHFEDIWLEAEKVVNEFAKQEGQSFLPFDSIVDDLNKIVASEDKDEQHMLFGRVLVNLAFFANLYNVNVWSALVDEVDNVKISMMQEEE